MMPLRAATIAMIALSSAVVGAWIGGQSARTNAPDAVLANGFGKALAHSGATWSPPPANVWLSGLGQPVGPRGRSIAIDDLITITGKDGRAIAVQVTALDHVDGAPIGLPSVRFQLVTARPAHAPDGKPMRFLFALDTPAHPATLPPAAAKGENGREL